MPLAFHPAPAPCRRCGTVLQASHAAENDFCCPGCQEPVCYTCGCSEERPCLRGEDAATRACHWADPGLCSFCGSRAAYELYMEATGRPATDPYYLELAPSAFVVLGLDAGLGAQGRLEEEFRQRAAAEGRVL